MLKLVILSAGMAGRAQEPQLADALRISVGAPEENDAVLVALAGMGSDA